MKLGKGYPIIQLYDENEVEQYSYTLTNVILDGLVQVQQLYEKDSERHVMANGEIREMIKGKRISIQIPIRVLEDITASDWETFLYLLYDWPGQGKIKVTPYDDEILYAYWCVFENGRRMQRDLNDIREIDTLEFTGSEIIDSIS